MSSRPITATAGAIFYTVRRRRGPFSARKAHNVTPVADLDFVILEITKRFRDFLAAGLATVDDATWPLTRVMRSVWLSRSLMANGSVASRPRDGFQWAG